MVTMDCSEFLDLYSDYRDGCLENVRVARAVREHLRDCEACMRYDATICRGVMALRSTDELEPTRTIAFRGLNVLPDSAEPVAPTPAKFAGAMMIAATVALLLWPHSENPVDSAPVAQAEPTPPPPVLVLPRPQPLPVRNIDPRPPVFHAQLQPRLEQVSFDEWVAVPD
jgi:hypothetical protein